MQLWMVNQASWFPCSFLNEGIRGIRLTNCWIQWLDIPTCHFLSNFDPWPIHRADITMKINHSCRKICQGHGWYGLGVRETNIFHTFLVTFYVGHMHHWGVNDPSHTTSNWEVGRVGSCGMVIMVCLGSVREQSWSPWSFNHLPRWSQLPIWGSFFWDTNPNLMLSYFRGAKISEKNHRTFIKAPSLNSLTGREFEALK